METLSAFVVQDIDPYSTWSGNPSGHIKKYLGISGLGPVCIIAGQSNSGKSVLLNNLFKKKLIYEYAPENIYFFSSTIRGDLTYKPLLRYFAHLGHKLNIKKEVDVEFIKKIVERQEKIAENQMLAMKKSDEPVLKKILFIFDDVLQDKAFKHHQSFLSTFATLCRHYGISMIILTQKWSAVPDTIRLQSNISILCSTDNYKKSMVEENALHGREKEFDAIYQEMNAKKNYSFMIINKSSAEHRNLVVSPDGTTQVF